MSVEQTTPTDTLEVKVAATTYVQVMMPSGVIQVFERPIYAEVAAVGPQGAAGPPGINGLPGPPGANAILGTWQNVWNVNLEYSPLDMVQWEGSTYLNPGPYMTGPAPGPEPPAPPWELVAAKGEDAAPFKYVHTQMTPDAVWTVVHGLNGYPNVTSVDSTDREIVGDVAYIDGNTLEVSFASATGGKAYIS